MQLGMKGSQPREPPTTSKRRLEFPKDASELLTQLKSESSDTESSEEEAISNFFFELANTDEIVFKGAADSKACLVFQQDRSACGKHTGGIVWETSYVLLHYLLAQKPSGNDIKPLLGHTLELGAGVGFLGQCLAAGGLTKSMVLTDTAEVLVHTTTTLEKNQASLAGADVSACALDWLHCQRDFHAAEQLGAKRFHTLLSTDVLFSPHLVDPLLETAALVAHEDSIWFLCVQIRCDKSHKAFLNRCPQYGFNVQDISEKLNVFGRSMECCLFRITRTCDPQPVKKRKWIDEGKSQKGTAGNQKV